MTSHARPSERHHGVGRRGAPAKGSSNGKSDDLSLISSVRDLQRKVGNRSAQRYLARYRDATRRPPRIEIKSISRSPAGEGDKGWGESEFQDQNASVTTLTTHANGVRIVVEAENVYCSTDFPEGFKWTQTIDTNVPKGGTTSPYVDPRPNDDAKPFYYTDAEHAASPNTFRDRPARPVPATGTTTWEAILGLNGVNETTKVVEGFDYMTYGFTIDAAGTVTQLGPGSLDGAGHRSILTSEFPGWTFR